MIFFSCCEMLKARRYYIKVLLDNVCYYIMITLWNL